MRMSMVRVVGMITLMVTHSHDHGACGGHDHSHSHDHGACDGHDHSHDHGACGGRDHSHDHGGCDGHDHSHAHGDCSGHDHAGHRHSPSGAKQTKRESKKGHAHVGACPHCLLADDDDDDDKKDKSDADSLNVYAAYLHVVADVGSNAVKWLVGFLLVIGVARDPAKPEQKAFTNWTRRELDALGALGVAALLMIGSLQLMYSLINTWCPSVFSKVGNPIVKVKAYIAAMLTRQSNANLLATPKAAAGTNTNNSSMIMARGGDKKRRRSQRRRSSQRLAQMSPANQHVVTPSTAAPIGEISQCCVACVKLVQAQRR